MVSDYARPGVIDLAWTGKHCHQRCRESPSIQERRLKNNAIQFPTLSCAQYIVIVWDSALILEGRCLRRFWSEDCLRSRFAILADWYVTQPLVFCVVLHSMQASHMIWPLAASYQWYALNPSRNCCHFQLGICHVRVAWPSDVLHHLTRGLGTAIRIFILDLIVFADWWAGLHDVTLFWICFNFWDKASDCGSCWDEIDFWLISFRSLCTCLDVWHLICRIKASRVLSSSS